MRRLVMCVLCGLVLMQSVVSIGAQVPADQFKAGFAKLGFIEGAWRQVGAPAAASGAGLSMTIAPYMGGKYLETHGNFGKADFQIIFAFNQPGDDYIMSIVDSQSGVLDVYHGTFDDRGTLVLTNPHFFRVSLMPMAEGRFSWIGAHSADNGATWTTNATYVLERV